MRIFPGEKLLSFLNLDRHRISAETIGGRKRGIIAIDAASPSYCAVAVGAAEASIHRDFLNLSTGENFREIFLIILIIWIHIS